MIHKKNMPTSAIALKLYAGLAAGKKKSKTSFSVLITEKNTNICKTFRNNRAVFFHAYFMVTMAISRATTSERKPVHIGILIPKGKIDVLISGS